MSNYDWTMKAGDTFPALEATLEVDGGPLDLTGSTVRFVATPEGGSTPAIDAPATVGGTPTTGDVTYAWADGDTDEYGCYDFVFKVTLPSGKQVTIPTEGTYKLKVEKNP